MISSNPLSLSSPSLLLLFSLSSPSLLFPLPQFIFFDHKYFVAPRFQFKRNMSHNFFIQVIVPDGGEGIILRKCGSLYEHGRSFSLLKLKVSFLLSLSLSLSILSLAPLSPLLQSMPSPLWLQERWFFRVCTHHSPPYLTC